MPGHLAISHPLEVCPLSRQGDQPLSVPITGSAFAFSSILYLLWHGRPLRVSLSLGQPIDLDMPHMRFEDRDDSGLVNHVVRILLVGEWQPSTERNHDVVGLLLQPAQRFDDVFSHQNG